MQSLMLLVLSPPQFCSTTDRVENVVPPRIEGVESRVNDLATFRWITVGVATTAAVIIASAGFFGNLLTVGNNGSTLGGANTTLSK